ncbi:hypothetical protein HMPREF0208_00272 [Citrobacter koseri]|nr:hypothetical protein HMPREF3220_01091 [Citrobacter koseri]KXA06114.1 hypothetical protein HMPREF3207_00488 [Citrobacter koseri]KXB47069.1 hypothetical protein HMPREF0208_00272 [Citrobacter koseri]
MEGRNQLLRQHHARRGHRQQQAGEKSHQQDASSGHQRFKRVFHGIVKLELKSHCPGYRRLTQIVAY